VELAGDCSHVLVRRQPAPGDLRMISAIARTVADLERIGDEAQKIARMARSLHERGSGALPVDLRHAADVALSMLRRTLDAFARMDAAAAAEAIRQDDAIDTEFQIG